jgi:hypothetical protein
MYIKCLSQFAKWLHQCHCTSEISKLRDLRNDIAHNSPVWKVRSVIDEQSAILYLNQQIDKIIEVIGWLSTDKVNWIQVHMLQAEAKRIATKVFIFMPKKKYEPC